VEERLAAITGDSRWYSNPSPAQGQARRRKKPAEHPIEPDPPDPPPEDYYAPSVPDELSAVADIDSDAQLD